MAQADFSRIASNIGALNALYSLRRTNNALGLHQTRLATGRRINSAEEDPAGLSIATKMGARSEGLKVALDNIGDAKNMLSVAEAGAGKINDILVQMRTKAEAAASDTLGSEERTAISAQLTAWQAEITAIVDTTKWNGNKLLNGLVDFGNTITFQVGADTDAADMITIDGADFAAMDATSLTVNALAVDTGDNARLAMDALDDAIGTVSANLGTLGALGGRLSFREETLTVAHANTEAAYNRIMNADMALEQVEVTKLSILQQTSMAMLGQANQMPQNILSLFR